jgi:uncharacterized protein (TIGR03382 family)
MPASASISVTQGPPCTASTICKGDDVCVMGQCIPGPSVGGGLGAVCQGDAQCLEMQCANGGETFEHCVAPCDPHASGSCPNGFDCLAAGSGGVCWPQSGGCCSASGDAGGSALCAAAVLGLVVRRRRRR